MEHPATTMDKKMQAIFAPLHANLIAQSLTDVDLLDLIAGFTGTNPTYAHAIASHARDFMNESNAAQSEVSYSAIISEAYRRTFFDRETAETYGTQGMLEQGEEMLQAFVNHLLVSHAMDSHQIASGNFIEGSDSQH